jgi:hypothetical protein
MRNSNGTGDIYGAGSVTAIQRKPIPNYADDIRTYLANNIALAPINNRYYKAVFVFSTAAKHKQRKKLGCRL